MYTSLDTQGRLSARLLSAQARSACLFFLLLLLFYSRGAYARRGGRRQRVHPEITGVNIIPFIYLGAKHMVTGYDHLLFLFGVIFFLYKMRDIGLYVSLFAIGHSTTLLIGTFFDISVSAYLIDAIIGLSVVYKALDNLGAFQRWFGVQPNTKLATLIFGFFHGLVWQPKSGEFEISPDGLFVNLIAFNIGVEIGQLLALSAILIVMSYWRQTASFFRHAYTANVVMMSAGFLLMSYQLCGYILA